VKKQQACYIYAQSFVPHVFFVNTKIPRHSFVFTAKSSNDVIIFGFLRPIENMISPTDMFPTMPQLALSISVITAPPPGLILRVTPSLPGGTLIDSFSYDLSSSSILHMWAMMMINHMDTLPQMHRAAHRPNSVIGPRQ
jgi:hypothetical protein